MSNGVQVTTTRDYFVFKIPKRWLIEKIFSSKEKRLTEEEALRIFQKGKKEYLAGKLKEVKDLAELLR